MSFRICNMTLYHNNMSWFSFVKNDYRPTIDRLYDLEHKPPFKIHTGETLIFRDDCSLSLNFMSKNRIIFPYYYC